MNGIQQVSEDKKVFIPFIAMGDPDLSVTEVLVPTMAEAGADLIKLGIPFSDSVAEGIVIQETDPRALASRTIADKVLDTVRRICQKMDVPLAFMTYINPVFVYGADKFMKNAADCGIDILIVPNMPFEEREELLPAYKKYDMTLIYLVAPISRERAQAMVRESDEFVYCVSSLGVTGARSEITTNIKEVVDTVRQGRDVPCAVGFGISTPEQANRMASQADRVIVGSAVMKMVAKYGVNCMEPVRDHIRQVKVTVGV